MGMFDSIDYPPQPCWKCGTMLNGWQSKDADCTLALLPPGEVRQFYDYCENCKAWNQYKVVVEAYHVEPDHGLDWWQKMLEDEGT